VKDILAQGQRALLESFATDNVLIALDYDGTLAPIVPDRDAAPMRPSTTALLRELASRFPCAVLSGRARADVAGRLGSAPIRWIVGNHGIEQEQSGLGRALPFADRVASVHAQLVRRLRDLPELEIEDKRLSLAIHYRKAKDKDEARALLSALAEEIWPDARIVGGKDVVSWLPPGAPHKGHALNALRVQARVTKAIYVGDDVTDEDVFAQDEPDRLLCIRVQEDASSAAPFFLVDQTEIDELLRVLIEARTKRA
jgi:trehalose 6-phosphate phosphatase